MGQGQTNQISPEKRQNIENEAPKINHPKFENPTFEKKKNDEEFIKIRIPIANEKEFTKWSDDLKRSPLNSDVNFFPQNYSFKKQGLCGSSGFAQVQYDNFPFILADQITNRQTLKQKFFQEPQLWYLVYTLLGAGKQFHKANQKVGDIRPNNIFINEDGQVKVANLLTWPSQQTNYQKTFFEKQTTYLAPQQLRQIQFAKIQPSTDPFIAESFSIGLSCLDASTLTSSSNLYLKNHKFDYTNLQNRLNTLNQIGYSQLLTMVIQNLCQVEPAKRGSSAQFFDWLSPFEESIINLQPFQPTSLPKILTQSTTTNLIQNQTFVPPQNSQTIVNNPQTIVNPLQTVSNHNIETIINPQQTIVNPQQTIVNTPVLNKPPIQTQQVINKPIIHQQPVQNTTVVRTSQTNSPLRVDQLSKNNIQNVKFDNLKSIPPQSIVQPVQQRQTVVHTNSYQPQQPIQQTITTSPITRSSYTRNIVNSSQKVQQFQERRNTTLIPHTYTVSKTVDEIENKPRQSENTHKSKIEFDLDKIDEQLQMSRKMFPS